MGETIATTGKKRADWWRDACEKSTKREEKLTAGLIDKDPIIQGLKAELQKEREEIEYQRESVSEERALTARVRLTLKEAKADLESMIENRNAYKADKYKWQREASRLRERLADMESERDQFSGLWRNHLDESPREDDNDWEREARQILCTDADVEQTIEAEGFSE